MTLTQALLLQYVTNKGGDWGTLAGRNMIIRWESGLGLGMRLGGMSVGVKLEGRVGLRSGRKPTEPLILA